MQRLARAACLIAVLGCVACDPNGKEKAKDDGRIAAPPAITSALGIDAGAVGLVAIDPAAPAGDLKAEMARFKGLDACVKEHASTDPLVGDALDAIGYDTLIRDSCRVLEALVEKDAKRCDPIASGALKERCRDTVAIVFAAPDGCPLDVPSEPSRGRGPLCLAVAARDLRLCALVAPSGRGRCEAMIKHDPKACDRAADGRDRCTRDVARYGSLLQGGQDKLPPLPATSGTLSISTDETKREDIAADLARGVVLYRKGIGWQVELGRFEHEGSSSLVLSAGRPARISARLVLGPNDTAEVERIELEVPKKGTLAFPGVSGAFHATYHAEKSRGGALTVSLSGKLGDVAVKLHAQAVVRDVVEDPSAPPSPRDRDL